MLKRLRIQFIAIIMALLTLLLGSVIGLIYHFTRQSLVKESRDMMDSLAASSFQLARLDEASNRVNLPYCMLQVNKYGEILATDGGYYGLSDEDFLQELIAVTYSSTDMQGEIPQYHLRYSRYLLQNGLFAVILAPAINMFPALGEEAGWRGYMMPRLKERFGLLNGRLLGGVVWGVWHWPLMLLVGYEYGTNYLGAPVLGLVVWCVVCFALNTLLDLLYEKTGCIWVPAIAHGAFNAIAALPQVLITPADAYYNVLGPMPIGLISVLPMLVVAVGLTLHQMKREQ